jgi:DNA-binding XRE family transcriptional regulator
VSRYPRSLAAIADDLEHAARTLSAREHTALRSRLRRLAAELRGRGSESTIAVARETTAEWHGRTPVAFWLAPDGLRLEAASLDPRGTLHVRFAAGPEYAVAPRRLGIRSRPVSAKLDDLEHGFVLAFANGRTIDVASDAVLHACEPSYHEAAAGRSPRALGARIRALRLVSGRTAAEVARDAGLARPNYARLEAGRHEPRTRTLLRVAEALNVPLALLFDGEERPHPRRSRTRVRR